jgi:hypothetical protein
MARIIDPRTPRLAKVSENFQIRSSYRAPLLELSNATEAPFFERLHVGWKHLSKLIRMSSAIDHKTTSSKHM